MMFLIIIFSILMVLTIGLTLEQMSFGQYFSCITPDGITKTYQNSTYSLNFEKYGCEFEMILTISHGNQIERISLNEKITGNEFIKMEIIKDNIYFVWNKRTPIPFDKTDVVDPGSLVGPGYMSDIYLKKISLDGKTIGKSRLLDYPFHPVKKIIDITEIDDKIWLFWQAGDLRTSKQDLIKTKINDEFFVDHTILVKDRLVPEIKKIVKVEESGLHLIFFYMGNGCEKYYPSGECRKNFDLFMLGTGIKNKPGFTYEILPPPAQLTKIGIPPHEVICKVGLALYYKNGNIPLCLNPGTGSYLYERGWNLTTEIEWP